MQFALTGEQPGKNKADLLHWGAKEGRVILEFDQDGKPGRIERSVSSNKVTLEYDGVTTSGITNVAKEMETRLHMDKDLVRQSVFVRQTEVDTIISAKTDKRDREVAFQKLLGIDAAKIHKNLTDWMYAATKPINYDIQLTDAEQRLGELEARKANLDNDVTAAEEAVKAVESSEGFDVGKLQKSVTAVTLAMTCADNLRMAKANADAANKSLEDAEASMSSFGENPGVDIAEKTEEASVLNEELRKQHEFDTCAKAVTDAEVKLQEAVSEPHPDKAEIDSKDAELRELSSRAVTIGHEIEVRKKALGALTGGESVCPVCGKPLDSGTLEHLRTELADYEKQSVEIGAKMHGLSVELSTLRNALAKWEHNNTTLSAIAESKRADLAKCHKSEIPPDVAERELANAQAAIRRQREYDALVKGKNETYEAAKLKASVATQNIADAEKRLADAEAAARELVGDTQAGWGDVKASLESMSESESKRRAEMTNKRMALASATASRDEVVRTIATLTKTVETLKTAQKEQDVLAKRLATLEKVRDWFHYANGPRILVTQVLAALTDDVNRFLGNFTAPFVVVPDNEEVGFRVEFTDGRDRPDDPPGTDVLSGGERVQLAVAVRLAIYSMFAGKLGLLSLDEPTAYLDDGNVDRFGVLLNKVRDIAKNMNTQVFMATHERGVIPHMDSIIDLN